MYVQGLRGLEYEVQILYCEFGVHCWDITAVCMYIGESLVGPGRLCFFLHLLCYAQVLSSLPIVLLFCHLLLQF